MHNKTYHKYCIYIENKISYKINIKTNNNFDFCNNT